MKRAFALSAVALLFGIVGMGCQNTAEGAKQDTANDASAVKEAGDKAVVSTEQAAQKAKEQAAAAAAATKAAGEKAVVGTEHAAQKAQQQAEAAASATEQAADRTAAATKKAADRTAAATKKAADRTAAATKKAADRTLSATEKAGKNASDALTLTPKVQGAINNDSELSNASINVASGSGMIALEGTVKSIAMKMHAEKVAKQAVQAAGSNDTVVNSLKVQGQ